MSKKYWLLGLILIVSLGMTTGMTNCGQSGTNPETEKVKKELDDLKKQTADEKLVKEKEEIAKQKESLSKEKQQLATEKKKAEVKKKEAATIDNTELDRKFIYSPDGFLNLRSKPSESGEILATGNNNELVEILEQGKVWSKVRFKGKVGYMGAKFLANHRSD